MQGKKSHQEKLFISFQLSEYVPSDNFYKRLNEILDLQFLYRSTAKYYGSEGQKSIDPVVFMKLMLVGYLENLNSDRRIINTSRMRMDILYFIGYDLDEELPWHSTLSRTRQLYGEEEFTAIFKQVLKQCIDKGMVAGKRQAIDSVLVKANASMDSLVERQIMEDAAVYSKELNANQEENTASKVIELPPTVSPVIEETNEQSKKVYHGSKASNKTFYSPSDPDARISVKPGKAYKLNYLSQVSVDTANHVITNIQAFHADKRDSHCFSEVLKQTVNNLRENEMVINEVIADSGYSSIPSLHALLNHNIVGYIPNPSQYKPNRDGFSYDKENDRYVCHQGAFLPFKNIHYHTNRWGKFYKSSKKVCNKCPFRESCVDKQGYKIIVDAIGKPLYDEMYYRLQTRKAKRLKKLRQSTVEPVIGSLVNYTGMKQVNTIGIKQANKCMIMAAVAYNLKKLLKHRPTNAQIKCNAMQKEVKKQLFKVPNLFSVQND